MMVLVYGGRPIVVRQVTMVEVNSIFPNGEAGLLNILYARAKWWRGHNEESYLWSTVLAGQLFTNKPVRGRVVALIPEHEAYHYDCLSSAGLPILGNWRWLC